MIEINTKQITTILLVSIALMALLGCVKQLPADGEQSLTGSEQTVTGEQVIGPEYYDHEEEAFDALGAELDSLEEPSAEELESILGE